MTLWEKTGDEQSIASGLINLGILSFKTRRYDQALSYLARQQRLASGPLEQGMMLMNRGLVYRSQGDLSAALQSIKEAEQLYVALGYGRGVARCRNNLGVIFLDQKQWQQAEMYLHNASQLWEQLQNPYGQAIASRNLELWQQRRQRIIYAWAVGKP